MAEVSSGVYAVYENVFKIGTKGMASAAPGDMVPIAEMESFSVAFDNGVEEWTPMDTEGWIKRAMTSKSMAITLSGKRTVGDAGNDYVAGLVFSNGKACETKFEWVLPSGTTVKFDCVVNVSSAGGDSTALDVLECEIMSNGKPTVTLPAA